MLTINSILHPPEPIHNAQEFYKAKEVLKWMNLERKLGKLSDDDAMERLQIKQKLYNYKHNIK